MSTNGELTTTEAPNLPEAIEKALMEGDLSRLTPEQRVVYYNRVCESVGLNPLTRPFDYIRLNGKLVLYAKRDATDQLRKRHGVSIEDVLDETIGDIYRVKAKAKDRDGRTDMAIGAVNLKGLNGEALANAYMKAETKAKRRVTLSICGLGILDETEVDSIPGAERVEERITDEQVADLDTLLENTGANRAAFLEHFHVKNLSELDPANYKLALRMLESKKAKAKAS